MQMPSREARESLGRALREAYAGKLPWLDDLAREAGYVRLPVGLDGDVSSRRGLAPELLEYKPVEEVARLIGCDAKTLKNYCKGMPGSPNLPHRLDGSQGRYKVQTAVAYEFLLQHAKRVPKGLHAPPGYVTAAQAEASAMPAVPIELREPLERLREAVSSPAIMASLGHEHVRVLAAAVDVLRRDAEAKEKLSKRYSEEEVCRMMQAVGQEWVRQYVLFAPYLADKVVAWLAERFLIQLAEKNISARQMLVALINNEGEAMIRAFRQFVEDQLKGVHYLEGTA